MTTQKAEETYNIAIVGNAGIGKTNLILRFADDIYTEQKVSTIGVDFKQRPVPVEDGTNVNLKVYDGAPPRGYRDANVIIVAFDLTDRRSYDHVRQWIGEAQRNCTDQARIVLVGLKSDEVLRRNVDQTSAKEFADTQWVNGEVKYYEASAKTGAGVQEVFQEIAQDLHQKRLDLEMSKSPAVTLNASVPKGVAQANESRPIAGLVEWAQTHIIENLRQVKEKIEFSLMKGQIKRALDKGTIYKLDSELNRRPEILPVLKECYKELTYDAKKRLNQLENKQGQYVDRLKDRLETRLHIISHLDRASYNNGMNAARAEVEARTTPTKGR